MDKPMTIIRDSHLNFVIVIGGQKVTVDRLCAIGACPNCFSVIGQLYAAAKAAHGTLHKQQKQES